jgi:hypothetical protein
MNEPALRREHKDRYADLLDRLRGGYAPWLEIWSPFRYDRGAASKELLLISIWCNAQYTNWIPNRQ